MLRAATKGRLLFLTSVIAMFAGPVSALPITFDVTPFTGTTALSRITLSDLGDGTLNVNVAVITDASNPNTADILGVFFDVSDDSLLGGFSFLGADITQSAQSGSVTGVGGGNNMNGGGPLNPGPFDIGLRIGTSGIGGGDDFQSTSFILSHSTASLDLSLLIGETFGVRLQSVGPPGGSRSGSSKLSGDVPDQPDDPPPQPVPEPASLALWGIGAVAVLVARRRARAGGD